VGRAYLKGLEYSDAFIYFVMQEPLDSIHWLTLADVNRFKLEVVWMEPQVARQQPPLTPPDCTPEHACAYAPIAKRVARW
jgi:hypothetical protein